MVLFIPRSSQAATRDWSATATTPAWALGTNWVGGTAPTNDLTSDIARFDQTSYISQPNSGVTGTSINGIQIGDGTTATATLTLTNTALSIGSSGITMFANAGAATLTGGSVKIGANQNWANNSSNLLTINSAVTNNGNTTPFTLTLNGSGSGGTTIGGIISNGGTTGTTALTINTTGGTTTLSGVNTYTGGTTLTLGTLKLSGSGTLGGTSGALTVNGGTLDLNGTSQGVGNFTGSGGTILNNSTGTNVTLTIGNGNGTGGNYSGVIADHTSGTGTMALTKTGTGTITLSGANTYTRATTINAGTLSVSSLANGGSSSNIGASTNAATNLILNGGTLQYTGAAVSTDRLFSVGTSGGTLDASGTGAVNFTNTGSMGFNNQTGARNLTLTGTNTGTNTVAAVIGDNGGATSITKNGTGNWVLGGTNTYTGATTINGGDLSTGTFTLNLSGAVSIASGATYTSTGTLNLNPDTSAAQTFVSGAGTLRLRNSSSTALAPDIYYDPTGNSTSGSGFPVTIASNIDVGTGTRYINGISQRDDYERYGGELVLSGNLSGSANLTFTGTPNTGGSPGTFQMAYALSGNNSGFTGGIILSDGANLTLNNANALTSANTVTFNPASGAVAGLYLYGRSVTIGALSGTSAGTMNIRNGSLVTDSNSPQNANIVRSNAVLTVQQDTNTTFNGTISDGVNDHGSGDSGTYYTLGLTKTGTGTLTLGGANTYTGGTNINGGTLALGSSGAIGSSGTISFGGGTLQYSASNTTDYSGRFSTATNQAYSIDTNSQNVTFASALTSSGGSLTKLGSGTLTLTGANTYTGGTTINGGILALGTDSGGTQNTAANSLGTGAITINSGAQLRLGGSSGAVVSYSFSNSTTLSGGTIVVADGAQHFTGTFAVGASGGSLTTQYAGKDLYLDGVVSGSGAVLVDNLAPANYGDGQVHFTGTNTYSGTLTVSASGSGSHGGKISVDSNNALASATIAMNGPRDINFATTAPVFGALSGTGNITLTSGLTLSVGGNNATTTYSGIFSGAGSLTKAGTGTMTLSGANTYTGATTVSAGVLNIQNASALGTTAGGTTVSSGAALQIQGGIAVGAEALTLNGSGIASDGALRNISGNNSYAGAITLASASTINSDSGTLTLTGNLNNGGFAATFGGASSIVDSGVISGGGSVNKNDAGTLTLSGTNTFTGDFYLNGGTVIITNNQSLGPQPPFLGSPLYAVHMANGTTLETDVSSFGGNRQLELVSGTATLNVGTGFTQTRNGLVYGAGGLIKAGLGTQILTNANTYTGATTISAGTLSLDSAGSTTARLANTSGISVNSGGTLLLANSSGTTSTDRINNSATVTISGGGTFKTGGLSEGTRPSNGSATDGAAGMGALTLQNTTSSSHATIDFGSTTAGSSLVFSSLSAASKGAYVDILNWGGTTFTDNGATTNDRLLFATDPGFTASDLANFAFSGYATGAVEITYGNLFEICPVPEPSTYVAGILTLSALFWNQRRRLFAVFRRNSN